MSSPIRHEIEEYLAGRASAERLATVIAEAFYRGAGRGNGRGAGSEKREALRPLVELIERAAPGIVALSKTESQPGFDVRLAERTFPPQVEAQLRVAAQQTLEKLPPDTLPATRFPLPEVVQRLILAIRRLISA